MYFENEGNKLVLFLTYNVTLTQTTHLLQGLELRVEVLQSSSQLSLFGELMLLYAQSAVELLHQELDVVQSFCFLVR